MNWSGELLNVRGMARFSAIFFLYNCRIPYAYRGRKCHCNWKIWGQRIRKRTSSLFSERAWYLSQKSNVTFSIKAISDDTDVPILLLHHYEWIQCTIIKQGTGTSLPPTSRTVTDIAATVDKRIVHYTTPPILAVYLTGCDSVVSMHGIGQATLLIESPGQV